MIFKYGSQSVSMSFFLHFWPQTH